MLKKTEKLSTLGFQSSPQQSMQKIAFSSFVNSPARSFANSQIRTSFCGVQVYKNKMEKLRQILHQSEHNHIREIQQESSHIEFLESTQASLTDLETKLKSISKLHIQSKFQAAKSILSNSSSHGLKKNYTGPKKHLTKTGHAQSIGNIYNLVQSQPFPTAKPKTQEMNRQFSRGRHLTDRLESSFAQAKQRKRPLGNGKQVNLYSEDQLNHLKFVQSDRVRGGSILERYSSADPVLKNARSQSKEWREKLLNSKSSAKGFEEDKTLKSTNGVNLLRSQIPKASEKASLKHRVSRQRKFKKPNMGSRHFSTPNMNTFFGNRQLSNSRKPRNKNQGWLSPKNRSRSGHKGSLLNSMRQSSRERGLKSKRRNKLSSQTSKLKKQYKAARKKKNIPGKNFNSLNKIEKPRVRKRGDYRKIGFTEPNKTFFKSISHKMPHFSAKNLKKGKQRRTFNDYRAQKSSNANTETYVKPFNNTLKKPNIDTNYLAKQTKQFLQDSQHTKSQLNSDNASLVKSKKLFQFERGDISTIQTCQSPVDLSFVPEGIRNLLNQAQISVSSDEEVADHFKFSSIKEESMTKLSEIRFSTRAPGIQSKQGSRYNSRLYPEARGRIRQDATSGIASEQKTSHQRKFLQQPQVDSGSRQAHLKTD